MVAAAFSSSSYATVPFSLGAQKTPHKRSLRIPSLSFVSRHIIRRNPLLMMCLAESFPARMSLLLKNMH